MIEERVTSDGVDYTTSYEYAIDGSLLKKTDRDGRVTAYYNDNFGRQVLERTYDSLADFTAVATPNRERVSTYNVFSWAITITEGEVHRRYGYDGLGRRASVTDSVSGMPEVVYTSAHSPAGQLTGLSATIDGVADFADAFTYNARGLLDSITRTGQSGGHAVADFHATVAYDDAGRQSQIDRYASAGTSALAVTTAFTHDEFGRLTALDHTQGATSLAAYSWSYDAAGQLLGQSSPDGSVVYS